MIAVRQVFQAKYGRGDELVALFKEMNTFPEMSGFRGRILTDASGPFFTVVTEFDVESLGAWEQMFSGNMPDPKFAEWFGRMVPLVESGRREFYNIVE
jgi:hypothetical protein